jgi:hypothetical protein
MAAGFKAMPLAKHANYRFRKAGRFFGKARFADMAFAPDLLSAQAAEEMLPLYLARFCGSGCAMTADAIYARAKYRPCRQTGREALNVAWVFMDRIIVSCAGFPQSSSRGNTSILNLKIFFARSDAPPRRTSRTTDANML